MNKLALLVLAIAMLACGCANYTEPVTLPQPQTPAERNFETLWQASLDTLRFYGWEIDRQDRRAGLIVTSPMIGGQWFEFWRRDHVGASGLAENSLQSIYRVATVRIASAQQGGDQFRAGVEVELTRSDMAEPKVRSVADAYDLFILAGVRENLSDSAMAAKLPPAKDRVSLGRDTVLEERIARRIEQAAGGGQFQP